MGLKLELLPEKQTLDDWFVEEVLPLEPMLMRFLRRNWRDQAELGDLRQETYVRIYEAARRKRPSPVKPFLFSVARNLMIDRLRRKNVVPIETMPEADWLNVSDLEPAPEQRVAARQELQLMQAALNLLPPRCRQVVVLRRVHGLSQREVAQTMGIKEETVESQMVKGMRLLTDAILEVRQPASRRPFRLWSRKGLS
jgi:RNA polymerase sigma-70 factor (ECF subfamily)